MHPFLTLLKLPSGGQFAAKGQSINIPIPFQDVASQLPHNIKDEPFLAVKYSSKSTKSHIISTANVQFALSWLHKHNHLYADFARTSDIDPLQAEQVHDDEHTTKIPSSDPMSDDDESYQHSSLIPNDYNVPICPTTENLDCIPSFTLPVLRGTPVNIFDHPTAEELAFPQLFPYGINGMTSIITSVTPKQYFRCRLLSNDRRWSSCLPYLFWALNVYEQYKLQSCISVAVKLKSSQENPLQAQHIMSGSFSNKVAEDYRFMKEMKGTSSYWRDQLYNLLAKMNILPFPQ